MAHCGNMKYNFLYQGWASNCGLKENELSKLNQVSEIV